jgi:hypothetical protein
MFGCSSEAWKAAVTKGLVRPPRCRACWRQRVATLWGGNRCSRGFSTSLHRPGAGGHAYGTCHLGQRSSDAVVLGSCERREKADKSTSDLTAHLAHVALQKERMSSGMRASPVPALRMLVVDPWPPEPTTMSQQVWRLIAMWTASCYHERSYSAHRCQGRGPRRIGSIIRAEPD